jgi:hypothetical protein
MLNYKYIIFFCLLLISFYLYYNIIIADFDQSFPKNVHLIYFPWNKDGSLKEDENDFDHSFLIKFKNDNPDWKVYMWSVSKMKNFINDNYPICSNIWNIVKHPVQIVDFCRLLVTYHYGGIYWQYGSIQKTSLSNFIPPINKSITLFVEKIISNEFSLKMCDEPIRNNKPEELIRISYGIFCAYAKNKFLLYCINKSWKNINKYTVKNQYDILYIGGNAMISEAFDEYENKNEIELIYNTNKYVKFSSNGSWRLNKY